MNMQVLAEDIRYRSLVSKIADLERRIALIEGSYEPKASRKTGKRAHSVMTQDEPAFSALAIICQPIADAFGITLDSLRGRDDIGCYDARRDAMRACRSAGMSLYSIGRFFDGRDHSTVTCALAAK